MNNTANLVEGLGNVCMGTMPQNGADALRLLKLAASQGNAKGQVSAITLDLSFLLFITPPRDRCASPSAMSTADGG